MGTTDAVLELSDANFDEEVFDTSEPVLVEFWSDRSYACRELDGVLQELAAQYADQVKVGRLDVESSWQTAETYNIQTTPTVLVFQNGRVVERIEGIGERAQYEQAIHEVIAQYWVI